MKPLKSKQEIWQRELALAQKPDYWKSFALETRCCAKFLLRKSEEFLNSDDHDDAFCVFFGYKYVRMLWGYALENAIKGLLLSGHRKGYYIKNDRISFGKRGHDLLWLLSELGITILPDRAFYVEAWSVSAEWFGKYPFPLEMNQVLDEYQPLKSSQALWRRSARGARKFIHDDLLHTGIGSTEQDTFEEVFFRVLNLYPKPD